MPDETPSPDDARPHPAHRSGDGESDARPEDDERSADTPPADVLGEAERLTRLAREAVDGSEAAAYRSHRAELLDEYGYTARVREDETRGVLVCHPAEWVEEGNVRPGRIDDLDRGVERPLSGPGDGADWEVVDDYNRGIVESVRAAHGDDHAANVAALADFTSNHYAKPIDDATRGELEEFLTDYYPRNAWPTPEQRDCVEKSVVLAFEAAGERAPIEQRR